MQFYLKDCFICNFCKNVCGACIEDIERIKNGVIDEKNKDLVGRKQEIECLGKYCDKPCEFQNLDAIPNTEVLINEIMFLGNKINEFLEKSNENNK